MRNITIDMARVVLTLFVLVLSVFLLLRILPEREFFILGFMCLLFLVYLDTVRISGFKKYFEDKEKLEEEGCSDMKCGSYNECDKVHCFQFYNKKGEMKN